MKFALKINGGSLGNTSNIIDDNDKLLLRNGGLSYNKYFAPIFDNKTKLLEVTWHFLILQFGNEIYNFHAGNDYLVDELNVPASNNQLEELLYNTHFKFKLEFEERRLEIPEFFQIPDINEKEVEQAVMKLKDILHELRA